MYILGRNVLSQSCVEFNSGSDEVGPIPLAPLLSKIHANWPLIGQLPLIGLTLN